ncbi:response regulator transcription factor [Streptomyces tirandamycinicus]|uniref:response regulator transcription factor n=1 Tax=Streptomyces TaxID=1883 RepID=UPI0003806918|nr:MULTISPECIES: response regulator transcription factor [Streptomyces]MCY0985257.1 response regulator transcription factor [Streptomyces tirandamycinicus]NNJ04864.1 response regulator transcription factor [Streptomyces sp. PKU-MA01144]TFE52958.1 response regulator transcription factor [Streptomyces sp. ICN441]
MRDSESRVRVVVADDHPVFRDGMVRALNSTGYTEVVAAVGDGRAALEAIREHSPDVALLDYRMPSIDGLGVAHAVQRDDLPTRVLILSAFTESSAVYEALREGASGYISKDASRDEIVSAVLSCAKGECVLPPDLVPGLASEVRQRAQSDAPVLSEREGQVLRMIAEGQSVPTMAKNLFLAPTTVKTHVQRLYEKLGVSDRGAAVAEAMRRGMLE